MTGNYEKTMQQLERAEAKLLKATEKKKALEAQKKMLLEKSENERLCSRGAILESFLKEPMILTNEDVSSLLELVFRSSFTQKELEKRIQSHGKNPQMNETMIITDPE